MLVKQIITGFILVYILEKLKTVRYMILAISYYVIANLYNSNPFETVKQKMAVLKLIPIHLALIEYIFVSVEICLTPEYTAHLPTNW